MHTNAFALQHDKYPPNGYFAERGFVTFAVKYRLVKVLRLPVRSTKYFYRLPECMRIVPTQGTTLPQDKGLYPLPLKHWNPKETFPHAQWTPYIWAMYPAVRDIKVRVAAT